MLRKHLAKAAMMAGASVILFAGPLAFIPAIPRSVGAETKPPRPIINPAQPQGGALQLNLVEAGIVPDGTTDNSAGIQAVLDKNPAADVVFPPTTAHFRLTHLVLTDAAGRNFHGRLIGTGGVIDCIDAGRAADTDVAAPRCIEGYQQHNGVGGDISGFRGEIRGLTINAPANGIGIYLAGAQMTTIEHNSVEGGRYGLVLESSQQIAVLRNTIKGYSNAGIALLMLNDTPRVWYASSRPSQSYFNDGITIQGNVLRGASPGAIAGIMDMGSRAEGTRDIRGNAFYQTGSYGYLGRNAEPTIEGANWFENIPYPIRMLSTNATEGGATANLAGVTAAQPNGTYSLGNFVDGYGYGTTVKGNYFAAAVNDINLSGVSGPALVGQNISQRVSGYHLVAQQGSVRVIDLGDVSLPAPGGGYKLIQYASYVDLTQPNAPVPPQISTAGSSGTISAAHMGSAVSTLAGYSWTLPSTPAAGYRVYVVNASSGSQTVRAPSGVRVVGAADGVATLPAGSTRQLEYVSATIGWVLE